MLGAAVMIGIDTGGAVMGGKEKGAGIATGTGVGKATGTGIGKGIAGIATGTGVGKTTGTGKGTATGTGGGIIVCATGDDTLPQSSS